MGKKRKILILIICFLLIIYFFPGFYSEFKAWKNRKSIENLQAKCPLPEKQGINICCYENNEWRLCNERKIFNCGEKIEIRITLDNIEVPSYLCIDQAFYPYPPYWVEPTDWTILYKDHIFTCLEDPTPDPDVLVRVERLPINMFLGGTIYEISGIKKLIKIFNFPTKNYSTVQEMVKDLKNAIEVLELEKQIICQ